MVPQSILVTGANGLIGLDLVRRLQSAGRRVVAVDRSVADVGAVTDTAFEVEIGDAHRLHDIATRFDIDAIAHCGGISGPMLARDNPAMLFRHQRRRHHRRCGGCPPVGGPPWPLSPGVLLVADGLRRTAAGRDRRGPPVAAAQLLRGEQGGWRGHRLVVRTGTSGRRHRAADHRGLWPASSDQLCAAADDRRRARRPSHPAAVRKGLSAAVGLCGRRRRWHPQGPRRRRLQASRLQHRRRDQPDHRQRRPTSSAN